MSLHPLVFFFGIFILLLMVGMFIYSVFQNKSARPKIISFLALVETQNPTVLNDISIKHVDHNHHKTRVSPYGKCDVYIFEQFIAIMRRQKFIFEIEFEPLVITSDEFIEDLASFRTYNVKVLNQVLFPRFQKGTLIIKYIDENFTHLKTEITLKNLTGEQLGKLQHIATWNRG